MSIFCRSNTIHCRHGHLVVSKRDCQICWKRLYRFNLQEQIFVGFNIKKLECGHSFHRSCLNEQLRCPVCTSISFTTQDMLILKAKKVSEKDLAYLKKFTHERAMIMINESIDRGNTDLTQTLVSLFDPTELVHHYIGKNHTRCLMEVIYSNRISWPGYYNDVSILDAASKTENKTVINIVRGARLLNRQSPSNNQYEYPHELLYENVPESEYLEPVL